MLNVIDLQEIDIGAQAQVAELEQEFQERFNAPLIEAALVMAVLENPELKAQLKKDDSQQYARVARAIKRMQQIARGGGE